MFFFVQFACSAHQRIERHPKVLTDDEVCNDHFLDTFEPYIETFISPNDYLCFMAKDYFPYRYNTFFVIGRNLTIVNQTHSVNNGFGGTGTRFRVQADTYGSPIYFYSIPNQMSYGTTWEINNYTYDTFFIFKEHWGNLIESEYNINEYISISVKSDYVIFFPYPGKSMNITIANLTNGTINFDINESTLTNITTETYFRVYPNEYIELYESDLTIVLNGTFYSSAYINISCEIEPYREFDENQLYWPDKVVRLANNSIYGPDTMDDYRLDGIHDPLDDVCYYEYIDPFNPPTFLPYNENFCFKAFTHEGKYYDTIFILSMSTTLYNGTDEYTGYGATGPRIGFYTSNGAGTNCTILFFSSVNSYLSEGISANIDQYFVLKDDWSGEMSLTYTVESGKITKIEGKVLCIFSDAIVSLFIDPSDGYAPIVQDNDDIFNKTLEYSAHKQAALTTKYESFIIPEVIYNNDLRDGVYKATVKTTISPRESHVLFPYPGAINKLVNNSVYTFDTLDDVYLDGVDHFDNSPADIKKITIMMIGIICGIVLLISIINRFCCKSVPQNQKLDNSDSSEYDPDIWIYEDIPNKRKQNKRK